jgi:hypothetical protein
MSRISELGSIRIPCASGDTQETAHLLIDEALGNKTTTDVLMALWFSFNRTAALKAYVPRDAPHPLHPSGARSLPCARVEPTVRGVEGMGEMICSG